MTTPFDVTQRAPMIHDFRLAGDRRANRARIPMRFANAAPSIEERHSNELIEDLHRDRIGAGGAPDRSFRSGAAFFRSGEKNSRHFR
ncbi:MAG TPA: hypothetical protein VH684_30305 [Xanthobacteraceae bacterium]|jgi:hypothetical protein